MAESIVEYAERMRSKAGVQKQSGNAFPVAPGLSIFNASKGEGVFREFRGSFEERFFRTPGRKRLAARRGLSDAQLFEEIEAGKRPDTLIVRGMCVRWFVESPEEDGGRGLLSFTRDGGWGGGAGERGGGEGGGGEGGGGDRGGGREEEGAGKGAAERGDGNAKGRRAGWGGGGSAEVLSKLFEHFGELGSHTETCERESESAKSKYAKKILVKERCKHIDLIFELSSSKASNAEAWADMTFDCFVQFRHYSGFLAASRALVGASFMCTKFEHADTVPCKVEVDFGGYFTKEGLRKRMVQAALHREEEERLGETRKRKARARVRSARGALQKLRRKLEDAMESFQLMVEVMEKLRLRCENYSGGQKYAGEAGGWKNASLPAMR